MKNRNGRTWIYPPADQWMAVWGFIVLAVVGMLASWILNFFTRLTGTLWIAWYLLALGAAILGASLILYAKLPLYRERRFLTFGPRAIPERRRPFYRCGYSLAVLGSALLACLLLSRP